MSKLNEFGILPPQEPSPALSTELSHYSFEEYSQLAGEHLLRLSALVMDEKVPALEKYPAKWHPSGFQVFNLGICPDLGFLRLHVWPKQLRKSLPKGDTIHDHAWHVASVVLAGTYSDSIYDINTEQPSAIDSDESWQYGLFTASYNTDRSQTLTTDGTLVRAVLRGKRNVQQGDEHFIEPGVFHQPEIPITEACATLVLNSFRVLPGGPYVLIEGSVGAIPEIREAISDEDIDQTKAMLRV